MIATTCFAPCSVTEVQDLPGVILPCFDCSTGGYTGPPPPTQTGIEEAPMDGHTYVRTDGEWHIFVKGMNGEWNLSNTTTPPPGAGEIRFNAVQELATAIYITKITGPGIDRTKQLQAIIPNTGIYIQERNNSNAYQGYNTTGAPIDRGDYFEIPVQWVTGSSGGITANNLYMVTTEPIDPTTFDPSALAYIPPTP